MKIALNMYPYTCFFQQHPHKYLESSGIRLPGFRSLLCQGRAVCPQANVFPSLCLRSLI